MVRSKAKPETKLNEVIKKLEQERDIYVERLRINIPPNGSVTNSQYTPESVSDDAIENGHYTPERLSDENMENSRYTPESMSDDNLENSQNGAEGQKPRFQDLYECAVDVYEELKRDREKATEQVEETAIKDEGETTSTPYSPPYPGFDGSFDVNDPAASAASAALSGVAALPAALYQDSEGSSKTAFNQHMNTHFDHTCPHCDYTSRTEGRLKRHIKDFHSEDADARREPGKPKSFKCRQCDFVAKEKEEYWQHTAAHIKEEKRLYCPQCPFVTEYKHHLEYHLRNHFNSKPFKCKKCKYTCVNKSMLNSHMKSHTNVYQYRCADCTYATKYCHSLKLHLQKYGHNAAVVLNPDGSLPTDGSGDFELVSKRGPPRGPRGPRKSLERDLSPGSSYMPRNSLEHGMMMPQPHQMNPMMPGFWPPGMLPGLQPPPPLIPLNFQQNEMFKCFRCDFSAESKPALEAHLVEVHNDEQKERIDPANSMIVAMAAQAAAKAHAERMASKDWPSMRNFGPHSYPPHIKEEMTRQASDLTHNTEEKKAEIPLDLTNKFNGDDYSNEDYSYEMNGGSSPGAKRRLYAEDEGESPQVSQTNGPTSPVRKRSRKGKAYKLDVLSMKLQQRQSAPTPEPEDDSMGEMPDDYPSAEDDYPPEDSNDATRDADDYIALHDSLRALNGSASPKDASTPAMFSASINRKKLLLEPENGARKGDDLAVKDDAGKYECQHCEMSFGDCTMYSIHMGYHGFGNPFTCNMCGHTAADKLKFFLHIARAAHE